MSKIDEQNEISAKKILILRSAKKAKTLKNFLRQKNFEVFSLAPQKIVFEPIEKKFSDPNLFDGIILTSANAIWAMEKFHFDKSKKIFAVGKKTAQSVESIGFKNCEFPKISSAQNLAILIKDYYKAKDSIDLSQKNLLYFRGQKVSFGLQNELNSKEIRVCEIVVYKQIPNPDFTAQIASIINKVKIDQILVFSNESLRVLANSLQRPCFLSYTSNLEIVCFSENIAANAAKYGFKNITTFVKKPFLKKFYELNNASS